MLLIRAMFYKLLTRRYIFKLTMYEHEGVSENNDSDDRNFFFLLLILQNYHLLNAYNFGLGRAKNSGTKIMKCDFD